MRRVFLLLAFLLSLAVSIAAQDTSHTAFRIRQGSTLPATCAIGDVFFLNTPTVGAYQCLTTNTWTAFGAGGGSGTVTTVSVVTNAGVSGSVANATTTPAITLSLAQINPLGVEMVGTAGAAHVYFPAQASINVVTSPGFSLTSDSTNRPVWATNGKSNVTFDFLSVTGARVVTFPDASITVARTDAAQVFTGVQTMTTPSFTTGFTIGGTATSRKLIVGNGTNFVPSTETYAVPGTSGNVLTSDGTNWTSAAPAGGGLTVGTTTIASGTGTRLLYETSGNKVGEISGVTSDGTTVTATAGNLVATSPKFITDISDTNGNEVFKITATASAVNEFTVANAATTAFPTLSATGGDTNIGMNIVQKGTGLIKVGLWYFDSLGQAGTQNTSSTSLGSGAALYQDVNTTVLGAFNSGGTISLRQNNVERAALVGSASNFNLAAGFFGLGSTTAPDVAVGRNAAGVAEINTGTANTLGLLLAGRVVTAKTSDYSVVTADKSKLFTNTGAVAGVNFTLPAAVAGNTYEYCRDANFLVTVTAPASTTIRVGASVTAAAGNVTLDAVGSCIQITAISTTQWFGRLTGAATFN